MTEITKPPASDKSRKRSKVIGVCSALALMAVAVYIYTQHVRIHRVESWGPVTLGMSEVDVTLAYGRSPDCPSEMKEDQSQKIMVFNGFSACSTILTFAKVANRFELARVCAEDPYPQRSIENFQHDYLATDEKSITNNLGEPSYVSVHHDGTAKIMNFAKYNVAFAIKKEEVVFFCVSRDLGSSPVQFEREYGES